MDRHSRIQALEAAFPLLPLPEMSLHQAYLLERCTGMGDLQRRVGGSRATRCLAQLAGL